ncbi:TPA: glycosyltransferase family 2 protein [Photobacterium damselae]
MDKIKVACIIPVFGREKLTKNFLESFNNSINNYNGTINVEVLVVDDHPEKTTIKFFKKYKEELSLKVNFINTRGDVWWCETVNTGINYYRERLDLDYIIIANNDIEFPIDFVEHLNNVIKIKPGVCLHPQTIDMKDFDKYHSSGCIIKSWFPYITKHPLNIGENKFKEIDLATARFLVVPFDKLYQVNGISKNLIQYQGDNDLSLKLKKIGIKTYIYSHSSCFLYNGDTGLKNTNITSWKMFFDSLFSKRSANNLSNKFAFLSNHHSLIVSIAILISMTINSFIKANLKR